MNKLKIRIRETTDLKLFRIGNINQLNSPNDLITWKKIIPFNKLPNNISGIYFLLNKDKEIIYIGKAKNIRQRIASHISPFNNQRMNIDIWRISAYKNKFNYTSIIPLNEVKFFAFIQLTNYEKEQFKELFYIGFFKPKYNFYKKPYS